MADKYLPLYLIDINDQIEAEIKRNDIDRLRDYGFTIANEEEYIKMLLELYFGHYPDMGKLLTCLMDMYGEMLKAMNLLNKTNVNNPHVILAELYDIILRPYILHNWKRNKQVYKIDGDFAQALLKTENICLSRDTFNHLPCKHFYVDVSEYIQFRPIQGIFVDIFNMQEEFAVCIYMVSNEAFWSNYDFIGFNEKGEAKINIEDFARNGLFDEFKYCDYDTHLKGKSVEKNINGLKPKEVAFFVYQLITYMTSHEPQVEESPLTKSTYRPPKQGATIKNKFSEIQMYDVGVRFGRAFKAQKKKYNCDTILTHHMAKARKSPIPHFRSAHWQTYWTGKGRTTPIVKWKEPTFVNGEAQDVVIHKV